MSAEEHRVAARFTEHEHVLVVEARHREPPPVRAEDWQPEAAFDPAAELQVETEAPAPAGVEELPAAEVEDEAEEEIQPPAVDPASPEGMLEAARQAASDGNLEEATKLYTKIIRKGKLVEEILADVKDLLRRHPVNVQLWQLLGDAYMRQDDLQEALDAYTKAENLLR